jgi:hypothetical protein
MAGQAAARPRRPLPLSSWDTGVVERARAGASQRLLDPECLAILDEFKDANGDTLRKKLDGLGLTATGYLQQVPFVDGSGIRSCRPEGVLMVANPGRATVYVCPAGSVSRLSREAIRRPSRAEFALIHEMLHTLGLGEDPPSSEQITRRVERRCSRQPRRDAEIVDILSRPPAIP